MRDIRTLKTRLRPGEDTRQNSPWNIAVNFLESMSFSPDEIATMLNAYTRDNGVVMDIDDMARRLYEFTSGYPFLISRLCKVMDEELPSCGRWTGSLLEQAVNQVLKEENTNFESLIKNLENDADLYQMAHDILLMEREYLYNADHPVMSRGVRYGIFDSRKSILTLHNRIYAERVYNYLTSKIKTSLGSLPDSTAIGSLTLPNGRLDFEALLLKFQAFMKEQYSEHDRDFLRPGSSE